MRYRAALLGLVVVAGAFALGLPARAVPLPDPIGRIDEEFACAEVTPAAAAPSAPLPPGARIPLRVLVLADGVAPERAKAVATATGAAFAPLGIDVVIPEVRPVSLAGADYRGLFRQMKMAVGGGRPASADVVVLFTKSDIGDRREDPAVVGVADCIGGVRFNNRAVAIVEDQRDETFRVGPASAFGGFVVKTFAHEVGHLLGAHHQYANCVEGIASELEQGEASPCTLMFNYIETISMNFSAANAAIVRGHAEEYVFPRPR